MDFSPHNIQRITEWILSEMDYNNIDPWDKIGFKDNQVVFEESDNKLNKFAIIAY